MSGVCCCCCHCCRCRCRCLPCCCSLGLPAPRANPHNTAASARLPGRALAIYEQQVRPALEAAGAQLSMHLTREQAHATGAAWATFGFVGGRPGLQARLRLEAGGHGPHGSLHAQACICMGATQLTASHPSPPLPASSPAIRDCQGCGAQLRGRHCRDWRRWNDARGAAGAAALK